ncbi:MAG: hypothetical protein MUC98_16910 [Desulfobacterota bacterium]|nr:hypothetical protein [Thermodesulfobacteriota bacterium]
MAMKESVGSLRLYFIVVALFAGFQSASLLVESPKNVIVVIDALLSFMFAVAYLCIGIALRKLLVKSSKFVMGVILASMGFLVLDFLSTLLVGLPFEIMGKLIRLVIGLLITWYLLSNVKRLSYELQFRRNA